jgi:hypothetical protein
LYTVAVNTFSTANMKKIYNFTETMLFHRVLKEHRRTLATMEEF